tara:strand:+ start:368 stop:1654 length:1287 start_codon:yes stop_codon:yes gene_type:complete
MRYKTIPSELFTKNRTRFWEKMANNSIAIFNSNDLMPKNADQLMPFVQNSDLFYLSGIDQEETVLIIIKSCQEIEEMLFIRKTSDLIRVWEGNKLTKEQAKKISGIKKIYWESDFEKMLPTIINDKKHIYLNSNDHPRATIVVETRDARFKKWIKQNYPDYIYKKSAHLLSGLRAVKQKEEVDLIQTACNITKKGVERVFKKLKPGIYEYELGAEILHEFLMNKASGFAYEPIIASGENACILHYCANNKQCKDGDLVLMDFGAEYGNYASDLTRCFPVSGRFSKRQRAVYNSVLKVMNGAKKLLKPGVFLQEYEKAVGALMEKELVDLGLISVKEINKLKNTQHPAYKKYYMHGTSHHLGLDVHDVSDPQLPLSSGMVLTCEPGIYIPEEGLGIRLENDILIGENKNIDLMEDIPIEVDEIEHLLNI